MSQPTFFRASTLWIASVGIAAFACSSPSSGPSDASTDCGDCDAGSTIADANPNQPDAMPGQFCDALGSFPSTWISGGPACGTEPDIQVHKLNDDTYILRQSLCTSFEAPFLYLLFGDDKALLEDTGDGNIDIVATVNALVAERETSVGHPIELVVVNSHGHGDHTQGNAAFANDGATVVGFSTAQLSSFFGLSAPRTPVTYDLGGRIIDIMGIPGHQSAHIAIYDRNYGILLTGDTLYPGRLYINDFAEYKASVSFLVEFTTSRDVCAVLGTHIEMSSTPGQDYDFGVNHHPSERELELSRATLVELNTAVQAMGNTPVRETHDDFIVYPL